MRLIDADKLKQHFAWWHEGGEDADRQAEIFEQIIDAQPTVYVEQIKWERDQAISQLQELGYDLGEKPKTGKWVSGDEMEDYPRIPYKPWFFYCSACGNEAPALHGEGDDYDFTAYCPNCGARMEAGDA